MLMYSQTYFLSALLLLVQLLVACNGLGIDCRPDAVPGSVICTDCMGPHDTKSDFQSLPVDVKHLTFRRCPILSLKNELFNYTELEHLEIDSAEITDLDENAFSKNTKLETLILTNNYFSLNLKQFGNLRKLKRLDLSSNGLQWIPKRAFENTTNLQNLSVGYNVLNEIAPQWFYNIKKLTYLDISKANITQFPNPVFNYTKKLEQLVFHEAQAVLNFTIGKEFLQLKSLRTFNVTDVGQFPVHLTSEFLSNLRNCPIDMLDLSANNINKVENDTFRYLPKLKDLILDLNNLPNSAIRNVFMGLNVTYLHQFSVIDNLENITVEATLFDGLRLNNITVGTLVFINANIGNIHDKAFQGTHLNGTIKLQVNNIKSLNKSTFEGLGELKQLILLGNKISKIDTAFDPLVNLKYLDLSENLITDVSPRIWAKMEKLQILYLMYNRIERIPSSAFADMKKLQYLNLYNNGMGDIKDHAFNGTTDLRQLILSRSHITNIYPDMFGHQENLRYLSFEDCRQLESINGTAPFTDLTMLSELSFQSCFKLRIEYKIFQNVTHLNYLQLDDVIEIAENTSVITDDDAFKNTNLRSLYASGLNITKYPTSLYNLNLTDLDLSYNQISKVYSPIVRMYMNKYNELRTFQLDHNPYYCTCDLADYVKFLNISSSYNGVEVGAQDDYQCTGPDAFLKHSIFDLDNKKYRCFNSMNPVPVMELVGPFIVQFVALAAVSLLSTILRYRLRVFHTIRKYLFGLFSKSDSYEYDGYLSYSNMDYNMVYDANNSFTFWMQLDDEVEDGNERFKLVIRDRDFLVNTQMENINNYMKKSRKLIFLLSDSFLLNEDQLDWCNTEINLAIQMVDNGDFSKIILIVKEPLNQPRPNWLDAFMREGVCLTWPTSRAEHFDFWERLRTHLRRPAQKAEAANPENCETAANHKKCTWCSLFCCFSCCCCQKELDHAEDAVPGINV